MLNKKNRFLRSYKGRESVEEKARIQTEQDMEWIAMRLCGKWERKGYDVFN